MALFGIKSCVNGKLVPFGATDDSDAIAIDYCNTFNIERASDSVEFRANGTPVINLESNVKVTFKVGMEVIGGKDVLAMILGGVYDKTTDKITVKKDAPTQMYKYEGIFTMDGDDGSKDIQKATMYKCKPQSNGAVDFSAIDISTFELTFDCFANPTTGEFYSVEENTKG